jgi:hypothetical protein
MSNAQRIVESRLEQESPTAIIYKDKVIRDGLLICPHCKAEIHEKGTYTENGKDYHRACGGQVKYRPPSKEDIAHLERMFGMKYDQENGNWTNDKSVKVAPDQDDDPNAEPSDYDEYA